LIHTVEIGPQTDGRIGSASLFIIRIRIVIPSSLFAYAQLILFLMKIRRIKYTTIIIIKDNSIILYIIISIIIYKIGWIVALELPSLIESIQPERNMAALEVNHQRALLDGLKHNRSARTSRYSTSLTLPL